MPGLVTVTVPAPTTALTTLAKVKRALNVTDTTDDLWLADLIDEASSVIAGHCRRTMGRETLSEVFRFGWDPGAGPASETVAPYGTPLNVQRKPLVLARAPVYSLTSVTENALALTAGTDFELDAGPGLLFRLYNGVRSSWRSPLVTVVYLAGYSLPGDASPNLPAAVEGAAIALIRDAYTARGLNSAIVSDQTEGVGRIMFAPGRAAGMAVDPALAAHLAPYVSRVA